MFADLHHLHHFISLEQGGSVTATSWVAGTNQGEADIYFGWKSLSFRFDFNNLSLLQLLTKYCAQVLSTSMLTTSPRIGSLMTRFPP
jgi:hypothetical protein